MPEKNSESLFKQQRKIRPKLEDKINEYFDGDIRESALDFAAWLRANKMSPRWASANSWKVMYKQKHVCYIKFDVEGYTLFDYPVEERAWYISFNSFTEYYHDFKAHGELKDIVTESLLHCKRCSQCHNCRIAFRNPDIEVTEKIKKVIQARNSVLI
jgi:hypothetical protein